MFLLEAMAYGLPLLSFDVDTGPRDLIMPGVNGFLVDSFDYDQYVARLGRLMDDVQLRRDFSASSKRAAQRFGEDAVYPRWTALIDALCPAATGAGNGAKGADAAAAAAGAGGADSATANAALKDGEA